VYRLRPSSPVHTSITHKIQYLRRYWILTLCPPVTKYNCSLHSNSTKCARPRLAVAKRHRSAFPKLKTCRRAGFLNACGPDRTRLLHSQVIFDFISLRSLNNENPFAPLQGLYTFWILFLQSSIKPQKVLRKLQVFASSPDTSQEIGSLLVHQKNKKHLFRR